MINMEDTIENKMRFFAQYWGQKVKRSYMPEQTSLETIGYQIFHIGHLIINGYLELKSVENIDRDDAVDYLIGISVTPEMWHIQSFIDSAKDEYNTDLYLADFLRSKGYALQFGSANVENLINMGWIKIKES
jgi:hypothetical protein